MFVIVYWFSNINKLKIKTNIEIKKGSESKSHSIALLNQIIFSKFCSSKSSKCLSYFFTNFSLLATHCAFKLDCLKAPLKSEFQAGTTIPYKMQHFTVKRINKIFIMIHSPLGNFTCVCDAWIGLLTAKLCRHYGTNCWVAQ